VFLHGLGEDSRSWARTQAALASTRTTYAVDARGHGGTTLGNANGTIEQLGQDLLGFLEAITGPAVCVGFSMGGAIVLKAASFGSPLVTHAICVCTSSVVGSRAATRFRDRAGAIGAHGQEFAVQALRENLESGVLVKPPGYFHEVDMRVDAIGDGAGYANGSLAMASMHERPLTPLLADVTVPVDVLAGELDAACPPKAGELIATSVENGRVHLMSGVGHFVGIENPTRLTGALAALDSAERGL
jgi:pimeloyl-ACP methyl ester carboxylesterase